MNMRALSCIFEKLKSCKGFSIDSRTITPGEVFIALDGPNFQGADFADHALAQGACAVVQSLWKDHKDPRILWAESPLHLLYHAARQRRLQIQGTVFAVTGSVGKTTTKAGLAHVLSTFGSVHASAASYNNHIGVPLTLANTPLDTQYSIFEVGTNQPGEIHDLVQYIRPDVSILTAVSEAHIGNFGSLEAIAEEKFSIFQGKVGVVPNSCVFKERLTARYPQHRWVTFGMEQGDIHLLDIRGNQVRVHTPQEEVHYTTTCTDLHWIENHLMILAAVHAAGLSVPQASRALESFYPLKGRGQVIHYPQLNAWCIDDTYNAAPQAMRGCLKAFAQRSVPGRKILILAEMGELADHSRALHEALIPYIKALGAAEIFLMGDAFKEIASVLCEEGLSVHWYEDIAVLCAQLREALLPHDTVWVKGKNSAQLWRVLENLHAWDCAKGI